MVTPFVDDALEVAEHLGPVVALAPGEKAPLRRSRGVKDATRSVARIEDLMGRVPVGANLGVAGGGGLFVLDIDPRNGGVEGLRALEAAVGQLPVTVTVSTPGNGRTRGSHFWLAGNVRSANLTATGIDVLSTGKYGVVPGSVTAAGRYEWVHAPEDVGVAEAPEALLAWLDDRTPPRVEVAGEEMLRLPGERRELPDRTWRLIRLGLGAEEHPERDSLLGSVVMSMVRCRWTFEEAVEVVTDPANAVSAKLGDKGKAWSDRELRRTWARCCAEVRRTEGAVTMGHRLIHALDLRGRAGNTDRRVFHHLLDEAAVNPSTSQLSIRHGEVRAKVRTTRRTLAKALGISETTAYKSLQRLGERGHLIREVKGTTYLGVSTPSVYLLRLPLGVLPATGYQVVQLDPPCVGK